MNIRSIILLTPVLLAVMLLQGCGVAVNGIREVVLVSTSPPGATCTVDRAGVRVGVVPRTPGRLRLVKGLGGLLVTCSKAGFQTVAAPVTYDASGQYPINIQVELAANDASRLPPNASYDPRLKYPAALYGPSVDVLPDTVAAHAAAY